MCEKWRIEKYNLYCHVFDQNEKYSGDTHRYSLHGWGSLPKGFRLGLFSGSLIKVTSTLLHLAHWCRIHRVAFRCKIVFISATWQRSYSVPTNSSLCTQAMFMHTGEAMYWSILCMYECTRQVRITIVIWKNEVIRNFILSHTYWEGEQKMNSSGKRSSHRSPIHNDHFLTRQHQQDLGCCCECWILLLWQFLAFVHYISVSLFLCHYMPVLVLSVTSSVFQCYIYVMWYGRHPDVPHLYFHRCIGVY